MLYILFGSLGLFIIALFYYISKLKRFKFDIDEWLNNSTGKKETRRFQRGFCNLYSCAPILAFSSGIAVAISYYMLHTYFNFVWSPIYIFGVILGIAIVTSAILRRYPSDFVKKYTHDSVHISIYGSRLTIEIVNPPLPIGKFRVLTNEEIDKMYESNNADL